MSILKSELKQLVTHEIGVRVDDALEAAKRDLSVIEGRQAAFADGAKAVEDLLTAVTKDVDDGKFELETAEHVKRYVMRSAEALKNLSHQAMNLRIAQTGKVQGFDHTVKLLANMIEDEKKKLAQQVAAAAAAGESLPKEEFAERPAAPRLMSIKEQRLAEEAPVEEKVEVEPPKKRRGRPPRAHNAG